MLSFYMNFRTDSYPSIQICSLGAAREIDHSTYDGVITIEDSLVDDPLRIDESDCAQLVLCFDDIASPKDEWIMPKERHVRSALEFADELGGGSLLIHCHAGISRSSGIALAIIAKGLGPGKEKEAFMELEKINPNCAPNALLVWFIDEILDRGGALYKMAKSMVRLTG